MGRCRDSRPRTACPRTQARVAAGAERCTQALRIRVRSRRRVDPYACPRVAPSPFGVHGFEGLLLRIKHVYVVTHASECEREPGCRRTDAALGAEPVQLRRDERDAARRHQALQPPSATRFAPVTYDEASEARKTTGPTTSCTSAMRPSGIRAV